MEIKCVRREDSDFPALLKKIAQPPKQLFYIGNIELTETLCVSIVGSRKCTEYGRWAASRLAERLGEHGVTVVSGMAMGIDSAAHRGAIKGNGKTIAVLGSGADICFPSSNKRLKQIIEEDGLVITEYPPGTRPSRYTFPQRNRIISGLSVATVIAEAGLNSGALITAGLADEQGRALYAIPGNINSIYSIGGNALIRDGVQPLVVLDDILKDLDIKRHEGVDEKWSLGEDEKKILSVIEKGGEVTYDHISERAGLPAGDVSGIVTVLEMKGLVYTALGKIFVAK